MNTETILPIEWNQCINTNWNELQQWCRCDKNSLRWNVTIDWSSENLDKEQKEKDEFLKIVNQLIFTKKQFTIVFTTHDNTIYGTFISNQMKEDLFQLFH